MRVASQPVRKSSPGPNFAITTGKPTLADLIRNLTTTKAAAEAACTKQGEAEQKYSFAGRPRPSIVGGTTEPFTITRGDKVETFGGGDWRYHSREEIQKSGRETLAAAKTPAERKAAKDRTAKLLAEFTAAEKAAASSYPRELAAAERAASRALGIWTDAEWALTQYRPTSAQEALDLLTLASAPQCRGQLYLDVDETGLQSIIANCAAALRKTLAD